MPRVRQRDGLGVVTKPRLLEIAAALGLGLPDRLQKPQVVDAIAASPRAAVPPDPRPAPPRRAEGDLPGSRARRLRPREGEDRGDRILGRRPDGSASTLTRAELAEDVAAVTGILKRDAAVIVDAMLETMAEALRSGESIEMRGFGSFGVRQRAARIGRNPATGAAVHVPPKRICYFKPGKVLVDVVNS